MLIFRWYWCFFDLVVTCVLVCLTKTLLHVQGMLYTQEPWSKFFLQVVLGKANHIFLEVLQIVLILACISLCIGKISWCWILHVFFVL